MSVWSPFFFGSGVTIACLRESVAQFCAVIGGKKLSLFSYVKNIPNSRSAYARIGGGILYSVIV